MVEEVAVGLEEGEPPVVVDCSGVLQLTARPVVDRVSQSDDEADRQAVGQPLHGAGHADLALAGLAVVDADAKVTEGQERDRVRPIVLSVGGEPLIRRS